MKNGYSWRGYFFTFLLRTIPLYFLPSCAAGLFRVTSGCRYGCRFGKNLRIMTHPAHQVIGDIIFFLLSTILAFGIIMVAYWVLKGAIRSLFGQQDDVPDVLTDEQKELYALPIGAPRDGGNYIYNGVGWVRMDEEEAEQIRGLLKLKAKEGRRDPEGWDMLMSQPDPTHPEMMLEVLNDDDGDFGPDDVEEEEIERPDEIPVHG